MRPLSIWLLAWLRTLLQILLHFWGYLVKYDIWFQVDCYFGWRDGNKVLFYQDAHVPAGLPQFQTLSLFASEDASFLDYYPRSCFRDIRAAIEAAQEIICITGKSHLLIEKWHFGFFYCNPGRIWIFNLWKNSLLNFYHFNFYYWHFSPQKTAEISRKTRHLCQWNHYFSNKIKYNFYSIFDWSGYNLKLVWFALPHSLLYLQFYDQFCGDQYSKSLFFRDTLSVFIYRENWSGMGNLWNKRPKGKIHINRMRCVLSQPLSSASTNSRSGSK